MRQAQPSWLSAPANIGACATGMIPIHDAGPGPGHLENYMSLPVEEYVVLDGANIERLGGDLFRLSVPRIEFFDVWIEPELEVSVRLIKQAGHAPKVLMQSQKTVIRGSEWIEKFNINNRFTSAFRAELKWQACPHPGGGAGRLMVKTGTEVYCEVFPPFNVVPKPTLESSCNAVLNTFVPALVKLFLSKLADDYSKWSSDAAYREERRVKGEKMRKVYPETASVKG